MKRLSFDGLYVLQFHTHHTSMKLWQYGNLRTGGDVSDLNSGPETFFTVSQITHHPVFKPEYPFMTVWPRLCQPPLSPIFINTSEAGNVGSS
jgi:hypothetical protein